MHTQTVYLWLRNFMSISDRRGRRCQAVSGGHGSESPHYLADEPLGDRGLGGVRVEESLLFSPSNAFLDYLLLWDCPNARATHTSFPEVCIKANVVLS